MVKIFLDHKKSARNFRGQNRKNRDRNTGKKQKQRGVRQRSRKTGRLRSVESKSEVHEGRCLRFSATITVNVENLGALPVPLQNRSRTSMENSSKGRPPRGSSPSGKRLQKLCKRSPQREIAQIHRCKSCILPVAKITNRK